MRVTSIGLYSSNDVLVAQLSFRDPKALNPYVVREIVGLDADEIVPRFYGQSVNNDGMFFDFSIPSREIVISILLNPNYGEDDKSYSDLRDDIYKAVSASRTGLITLKFYNGEEEKARLSAFVTKLEYAHFTDLPEIQLTLRCEDPMLKGPTQILLHGRSNMDNSIFEIKDSTAPHGFEFQATFTATSANFSIRAPDLDWEFLVKPSSNFLIGDVLTFSSESGHKQLKMTRGATDTFLVDRIDKASIWPILFPGTNKFMHTSVIQWNYIRYYPTYWGI
jgi:hypothetical protein